MSKSFKVEVQTYDSGKWYGNACRYPTKEEAEIAAQDLACRWLLVRDYRAVESEDPPNYTLVKTDNGRYNMIALPPAAPAQPEGV